VQDGAVTADEVTAPRHSGDRNGRESREVSDEAVRRLAEAVTRLSNDPIWFLDALTETVLAMKPISAQRLTKQQRDFLVESGDFTVESLAATSKWVDRGALQLGAVEAFLSNLVATLSLDEVCDFLELNEEAVETAFSEGRLYGVQISGRWRFPTWQFNVGSPEKLITGLSEIITIITPRKDWQSVAGFMATPQSGLVGDGRKTPVAWLRDGGDVDAVREIIESDDWR